jgi:hypothetical protein
MSQTEEASAACSGRVLEWERSYPEVPAMTDSDVLNQPTGGELMT